MSAVAKHIFLADDDDDDRLLFEDAFDELNLPVRITMVKDGEQLMNYLSTVSGALPDALFLDLNMPRKNGFTCLKEIKSNQRLSVIPVIIFSTSYEKGVADRLYDQGAHYYIRKPADFGDLKRAISSAYHVLLETKLQPPKDKFLISHQKPIS